MILSGQTIRRRCMQQDMLSPFREKYVGSNGCSCGLSIAGYDITLDHDATFLSRELTLVAAAEHFSMPPDVLGIVHDKSSIARLKLVVHNTVIEPGWRGFLTVEVTSYRDDPYCIKAGDAIAQVVFHLLDEGAERPYDGKYQDQRRGPQTPLREDGSPL